MTIDRKDLVDRASKHAWSLLDEFKNFALKGNVVDLAVGVIIGAAFGSIVNSLVKTIIMPLVAVVLPGEQGYLSWKAEVPTLWGGTSVIPYGLFLGEVINFLIVALALFIFIKKFLGWVLRARKQEPAAQAPPPTKEQELLTEIRDLLKNRPAG